jgi:hypothetical protein
MTSFSSELIGDFAELKLILMVYHISFFSAHAASQFSPSLSIQGK